MMRESSSFFISPPPQNAKAAVRDKVEDRQVCLLVGVGRVGVPSPAGCVADPDHRALILLGLTPWDMLRCVIDKNLWQMVEYECRQTAASNA
jgi:hypothetical protein